MATRTQIASDNFNRASLGANWSQLRTSSGIIIGGSAYITSDNYTALAVWAGAGVFTDDQYSVLKLYDDPNYTDDQFGVVVRGSGLDTTYQCYYVRFDDQASHGNELQTVIYRVNAGVISGALATANLTWDIGNTIELEVIGSNPVVLTVYKNGSPTAITYSDSSADRISTGGNPGVVINGQGLRGDDWEGGKLTSDRTSFVMPFSG